MDKHVIFKVVPRTITDGLTTYTIGGFRVTTVERPVSLNYYNPELLLTYLKPDGSYAGLQKTANVNDLILATAVKILVDAGATDLSDPLQKVGKPTADAITQQVSALFSGLISGNFTTVYQCADGLAGQLGFDLLPFDQQFGPTNLPVFNN